MKYLSEYKYYIKLYEKIDFDDWDEEEDEPLDTDSEISMLDLYEKLDKDIISVCKWLNDNFSNKYVEILDSHDALIFDGKVKKFTHSQENSNYIDKLISDGKDTKILSLNTNPKRWISVYIKDKLIPIINNESNESKNIDWDDWDVQEEDLSEFNSDVILNLIDEYKYEDDSFGNFGIVFKIKLNLWDNFVDFANENNIIWNSNKKLKHNDIVYISDCKNHIYIIIETYNRITYVCDNKRGLIYLHDNFKKVYDVEKNKFIDV